MAGFTSEQIANAIYNGVITGLAYDPDLDTLAEARRINSGEGWTIEESLDNRIQGDIIRYEGVRVSDAAVDAAHDLAIAWL